MPHYVLNEELFWFDTPEEAAKYQQNAVEISDSEAANIREKKELDRLGSMTYAQRRQMEYPSVADYLDGIVKGDQAQIDAYVAACLAVKAKYPKPGDRQ